MAKLGIFGETENWLSRVFDQLPASFETKLVDFAISSGYLQQKGEFLHFYTFIRACTKYFARRFLASWKVNDKVVIIFLLRRIYTNIVYLGNFGNTRVSLTWLRHNGRIKQSVCKLAELNNSSTNKLNGPNNLLSLEYIIYLQFICKFIKRYFHEYFDIIFASCNKWYKYIVKK